MSGATNWDNLHDKSLCFCHLQKPRGEIPGKRELYFVKSAGAWENGSDGSIISNFIQQSGSGIYLNY